MSSVHCKALCFQIKSNRDIGLIFQHATYIQLFGKYYYCKLKTVGGVNPFCGIVHFGLCGLDLLIKHNK